MLDTDFLNKVFIRLFRILNRHKFEYLGRNVRMSIPLKIQGSQYIRIGERVRIGRSVWLSASKLYPDKNPKIIIGEDSYIGNFCHIYCTDQISLGKKVLIADRVYISDNSHAYEDPQLPIIDQPVKQLSIVRIGDGSWIGENVCIIGASIGNNCVIGANAVVTKNIPDYSVAVGTPAKIIKKYNFLDNSWAKQ